ncbi:LysR family transcriptional regulator [Granulicella sp. dw_53]|uniref:LysR family transcriptional regulator n=1 Tax=Granulicella sp. dw_53 TaxID=2719792 RepID=UPI002103916A|nr:LysR family transcriptional regulator [Granulicella sp. dw_53]
MYEWAELRHFRYLLTILEKQGFRAAAEELRTAQPNLSVQARQFQENASVRLFRKMKGGRIRPTDTGIAFKVLARILLETRDEVLDALIAIERGDIQSVRFGLLPWWIRNCSELFAIYTKRSFLPARYVQPMETRRI